ncbi:PH domain-containing protein [Alteromonas sp. S167]|uniref:PH domain-containing protein n=1 Tax=Alteromonas sp. S167 TaxID=3117402 RepID=UPI002FDF1105
MSERIILNATFNPAVKTYWLISLLLVSTISIVGIPFLIISIPIFFLISSKVLAAMSAIVTERKIVVKRGVFNKEEKSIPLEKITDVAMVQGPLMRVFNLYRLSFETAGQSAQGALVSLIGINDADTFRETILAQKDKLLTSTSVVPEQNTDESSDMKELIESVKRIELLLEKALESK